MSTRRTTRRLRAIPALMMALAAGVVAVPAASADTGVQSAWPNDTFSVCTVGCTGGATGGIIWGNRTATVQGSVTDYYGFGTTVYFDAYAGSTKIDSTTRGVINGKRSYNFSIGNPDLVGGFDRLKVQVCETGGYWCSDPVQLIRDGIAEHN